MSTPLLATKLFIPQPRPKAVSRPRLIERLNEALHRKLTLISAPAGFGKTTLVSEWLVASAGRSRLEGPRQVAWLSLDENDSNHPRFLTYLVASLQTIAPNLGEGVASALQSPQPPPIESVLTALLNELATIPDKFVLVLDDYHVIDAQAVDYALTFLIEYLPPAMHLVITTREDPPLPLARYRARGHLFELRANDLRFTASEAAEFLNQVMGLKLSAQEIATLESQTEGWIAGLQLAALSMQGHEDVAGFIRAFAGDHRYIVDYLVEEVLQRQPERVRTFLLQTAILERLSGPLCSAVTGQNDSKMLLEALERGNFFVVPLDDKRHWYRYHHLFADVLHAHLVAEQPDQLLTLHRRASAWYAQQGLTAEAIHHALAAADFAHAADLVELALPAIRRSRQESTLLGWLRVLPDALIYYRPVLSAAYAHVLLALGKLDGVEERLRNAERWLDTGLDTKTGAIIVDEKAFRRLPGAIAVWRAGQALAQGNVPETVTHARRALDLIPEEDHLMHGAAASLLGIASWTNGDLEAAHRGYAEGMARMQMAEHIADAVGCAIALADIRIAQGRLQEAMRTYEQALEMATAQHPDFGVSAQSNVGARPVVRGMAGLYVGMSELHREHDDLQAATQHLLRSQALGEHTGLPQNRYRWRVAMARIHEAQGDLAGALALLHEAEHLYVSDYFPNVRPVAALKTRVWVAQGRLEEALGWVRAQGLSAHDDLSYLREFEHITLARILLARYQSDRANHSLLEAVGLLQRLLEAAEAGGRTERVIEILVLQALAHQMRGDIPAALAPLARALTLAEPEGYVRIFVDEGPAMAQLLRENAIRRSMPNYTARLLATFEGEQLPNAGKSPLPISPAAHPLIESLSERELEVLRLLGTDLSGPEIARELTVSPHTMNTHTKNIYSKLGVNNRRAAVRRAEELNLL